MTLGARIQERLKLLDLSQAELARRVGVRQSTMNSLIRGNSQTTRSLISIARELRTTPAYLMGETDDPDDRESTGTGSLDTQDRELLDSFHELDAADRHAVLRITRALVMAQVAEGATLHSRKNAFRGFEGE